jgi:hypothetical protein
MKHRFGRCRLGFFVAPGSFTAAFKGALRAEAKDDSLVVLIEREALRDLVLSTDRNGALKRLHEQAVLGQNGR